jgi:O-succinylbenzoic acid--CoA ligase
MDQGKIIWKSQSYSPLQFANEFSDHSEEWLRSTSEFIQAWFDSKDFIKTKTSGSTGEPKTIKLSKQTMLEGALKTIRYLDLKKGIQAFNCLPANYIAGRMMLVRTIAGDWNLHIDKPTNTPVVPPKVEFTALTPPQLDHIISTNQSPRVILVGGAPLSRDLESRIILAGSMNVYLTYGMTETASHVALRKVNGKDRSPHFMAIPGVSFETNEHKQLIIHANHVAISPLITNDIVELISDAEFLWIGRLDNVINSGGLKLYPEKIENELGRVMSNPFFIEAIEHERWGKVPAIVMENDPNFFPNWKLADLNNYEFPKELIFVRKLIYTPSGKIDRKSTLKEENIYQRQSIKP